MATGMTVQDTSRVGAVHLSPGTHPVGAARRFRRLPTQRDWPFWLIVAIQIGILVGAVALWQAAVDFGWIDGFF